MSVADDCETWRPVLIRWIAARGASDPEDLAAEAIVRSWLAERKGQTINRNFTFTCGANLLYDQFRRRRPDMRTLDAADDPPAPEHDWDAGQEAERLLAAMEPRQAEALRMMAAGYSGEEIGRDLGCSENAVRRLVFRGRARARKVA